MDYYSGSLMDNPATQQAGENRPSSTLQRLKDRARSVDRYMSQQRLGAPRTTTRGTSVMRADGAAPPAHEQAQQQQPRKSRPAAPLNGNGHVRQPSQRWRSPSINSRLQQNLQNLVGYLFERKNDAKKRVLAERLLWTALRRNEVVLLRDIMDQLQDPSFDINTKNEFGWNLVDEAVMLGFVEIAGELFKREAKESPELRSKSQRQDILRRALRALEMVQATSRMQENVSTKVLAADVASGPTFAVVQQMIQFVEKTRPPRNFLDEVKVQAWSDTSIALSFHMKPVSPGVISRFKVEWCRNRNFESAVDFEIFQDIMNPNQLVVEGLGGEPYFFRVSVANLAGFGMPVVAHPAPLTITSWRDVKQTEPPTSWNESLSELGKILQHVENLEHVVASGPDRRNSVRTVQRRPSLKDSIKSMIKTVQARSSSLEDGGLFLGSLIATNDTILLTTDMTLPVCLIQSPFLGTLSAKQYLWLQKLASVPTLATPLKDLLHSSKDSTSDIRYSIVQAILSLQAFLGLEDMGQPYFRALHDETSRLTLLLLIKRIEGPEMYRPPFGLKWVHLKEVELLSIGTCDEMLMLLSSIGITELLSYDRATRSVLPPGLHLGFVQLQPSLDNVAVVVTKAHPSTLPSVKVRRNPHVNRDEWESLVFGQSRRRLSPSRNSTSSQFQEEILSSWNKLKNSFSMKSVDEPYLFESILELGPQTNMLVLYSDARGIAARKSLDDELRRGSLSMAVQTLESLNFGGYRKEHWDQYCQSSLILDALSVYLNQSQREVFGDDNDMRNLLNQVHVLQDRLERTWSKCRWLPDVIRTVTSRMTRRIPLLPPPQTLPPCHAKPLHPPKVPPKPPALCSSKEAYDQLSVTVAIQPKTVESVPSETIRPDNSHTTRRDRRLFKDGPDATLNVKIDSTTTAQDVVRQVLMRTVGSLASKLLPFYRLGLLFNGKQTVLEAEDIVKNHCGPLKETQFFLLRQ